jgi:hypothetical protein
MVTVPRGSGLTTAALTKSEDLMDPRLTTRLANLWRGSCCHSCAAELLLLWLLYHTAGRSLCGGSTDRTRLSFRGGDTAASTTRR